MDKNINDKLAKIQAKLKAPKNQFNSFGKYKYRSCEDILEAVKPLLAEAGLGIRIHDEVVNVGDRYYVKATATIGYGDLSAETTAYAREAETKKGMDSAQITGATSSYARKYALNGLFAIDDTKDADSTNTHGQETHAKPKPKKPTTKKGRNDEIKKTLKKHGKSLDKEHIEIVQDLMGDSLIDDMSSQEFDELLEAIEFKIKGE